MAYHNAKISKGILGEFSKITEEYEELKDAIEQDNKVLVICELSDLLGAIELYANKYNLNIQDIMKFSHATADAFKKGQR